MTRRLSPPSPPTPRPPLLSHIARFAFLIALLAGASAVARAQGSVQIISQVGTHVTVTPTCIASHNCLDVALLNIPHVICDSGCSGGGGGGGTSSNFGATFPTAGTAAGASDGTNMQPLLVDGSGNLKTVFSNTSIAATQSGTWNIGTLTSITNPVAVTGTFFQATQAVSCASAATCPSAVTQTTSPWIVAGGGTAGAPGTAVLTVQGIGSGTPVPVSGSVIAACSTACEVSPTTAANTLSNQFFTQLSDGTHGNTFMSTTTASKWGADVNLLSILGTAPTTAGFLDIKGADGNVFVRQTSAANFNATVVGTGTFATQSAITAASGSIASGAIASGALASGSVVDGAIVTMGTKADAKNAATDTTAVSQISILKEISSLEQTPASRAVTNVGTFATQSAITAASGSIASGAIASGAIASGAVASGAIASGACASGCIADGGVTTLGAKADAKNAATDTTAVSEISILKEISSLEQVPAALPANQSVNVSQLNAHTTAECGLNGCLAVGGATADGSAATTDPVPIAGKGAAGVNRVPVVCDGWAPFSLASTTALKIISLVSGKNIYICSINIVSAAANNVALIDGTNSTTDCNAATHGMAGGTTAATGWNFAANGGLTQGTGIGVIAATVTVSHDVCLLASGSGQLSGVVSWTDF